MSNQYKKPLPHGQAPTSGDQKDDAAKVAPSTTKSEKPSQSPAVKPTEGVTKTAVTSTGVRER